MSDLIFYAHEYKGAEKLKANVASVNLLPMPSSHMMGSVCILPFVYIENL